MERVGFLVQLIPLSHSKVVLPDSASGESHHFVVVNSPPACIVKSAGKV